MTDQELRDLVAENARTIKALRASQEKTDEQMKRTDERIDRLGQRFGDFGNTRGQEVEEFFYRYFCRHPELLGTTFDEVDRNIITADGDEHDIILVNGQITALISVKYKLYKKDVDSLVAKELKRIQHFLDKWGSTHVLYGGVASYIVSEEVSKYAQDKGLYVITRSGENTVFLNKKSFRAKSF
ncbi:MAG: hypothetical protein HQK83_20025 [Fibrobacteria bacterium]|nr:hypothetical protein [Fibrobacteria bacterium]